MKLSIEHYGNLHNDDIEGYYFVSGFDEIGFDFHLNEDTTYKGYNNDMGISIGVRINQINNNYYKVNNYDYCI